jgi:hypothetical protein
VLEIWDLNEFIFEKQDTKTQSLIFTNSFALCLCVLVAIFQVYPGYGG